MMLKKILTFFTLCTAFVPLLIPESGLAASSDFIQLRIAATIAMETSGRNNNTDRSPERLVAAVIKTRYDNQKRKYAVTWADILYGNNEFENSRSLANKTSEELMAWGRSRAGANWNKCLEAARDAMNGSILNKVNLGGANSFNTSHNKGNKAGTVSDTLFKDTIGHRFYWQQLGQFNKYSNYVYYDENEPSTGKAVGKNASTSAGVTNLPSGSGSGGGSGSSGGSGSGGYSPAKRDKPNGYDNRELCAFDAMSKLYLDTGKEENKACWYCNVVVILTNAYLSAAAGALPSAIALGELILKLGFMVWLAYYILQQVSSFNPITPSKLIQEILTMGFKVSLAYLGVKYADSVIVEYYVNPIGGIGMDYGVALFDKLYPANAIQ